MSSLLKLKDITYAPEQYGFLKKKKLQNDILKKISFDIETGKIIGIVGESGSGKTTLAKLITGLIQPTSGNLTTYFAHKKDLTKISPIQILFQNSNELINPLRKVDVILHESLNNGAALKKLCELVNIPEGLMSKRGYQLSGGERQRVALARLLAVEPQLLILDEPFSAQDFESEQNFVKIFKDINTEFKLTILCITHNIELLKDFADEIIVLYGGQIMEMGIAEKIIVQPRHPYTKFLTMAGNYNLERSDFSEFDTTELNLNPICSYYSRCKSRSDKCVYKIETKSDNGITTYCNHPV